MQIVKYKTKARSVKQNVNDRRIASHIYVGNFKKRNDNVSFFLPSILILGCFYTEYQFMLYNLVKLQTRYVFSVSVPIFYSTLLSFQLSHKPSSNYIAKETYKRSLVKFE